MVKKAITILCLVAFCIANMTAQTPAKKTVKADEDDDDTDTIPARHVNRVVSNHIDTEFEKNKDKGEGPYKEFHSNKKLSLEGAYKNYKEVGLWKRYYENGTISTKVYHNSTGEQDSTFSYNDKGKVTGEMRWKANKKNGVWREYSSAGEIQKFETYKDGDLNGKSISYSDGKKYIESTYLSGTLEGAWTEYHENGKPRKAGNYKAGQKHGEWKKFDEEGTVTETEKYVNGETKD